MNKLLFRSSIYLFVSVLVTTTLFSQQLFLENGTPSHPNVLSYSSPTRSIIDLSGEWNYSLDNGVSWEKVKIPAAANYEGKIVYRKKFSVDERSIQNNTFTFVSYGINYQAEMYINETFIGRHEGGYTSFEISVPDNIVQVGSENVIRVVVDNSLNHKSTFPLRAQVNGWKNYNGIIRDIFIVAAPKLSVEKVNVVVEAIEPKSTKLLVTATVSAKDVQALTQLSNKSFHLSAEVAEAGNGIVIGKPTIVPIVPQPNSTVSAQISIAIPNAKLWSPDSPELYSVKISLFAVEGKRDSLLDAVSVSTGIRTFTRDKNNLLFNGAPIQLRGVVWIEDSRLHGSSLTYEEMERDVALIKNLGANTVRVGFHPPHPFFIQLCDRYGLLVMEEIPNFEIPAKIFDEENYRALVTNYLKDMIERDRHNPSVIAWGLGEGSDAASDAEKNIVSQLHRTAKSLDDRLTYFVTRGGDDEGSSVADIGAISFSTIDIKKFRSRIRSYKEANSKKPIIVAGYGKAIEKGNRNGYSDPNSQESQARYIQQRYAIIKEMNLSGSMIFAFNDFNSDRPIMHIKPIAPTVHTVGIVELDREKKSAYDVVHSMYHDQKISALPIGNYVPASPYVYVVIGLALLIIAAWLVNGNRRFRESMRRAIFNSYNFFADIRDQFTLPLFHTTLTAFIIAITISVIFSSILHHFRTSVVLDYILSHLFSDNLKKIVIEMSWNPLVGVGYFSGITVAWFLGLTLLIQIMALIARVKIRLFHSYSIAVWTALPWIFFIPVGMILYRVLESEVYVPWVLGVVVFMSAWVYLRTLKGISVIYHIYTPKMYMIGVTVLLVICGSIYAYLDYMYSLSLYVEYFATHILPFIN